MANKTGGVKINIVLHIVSMSTASRIDTTGDLVKVNSDNQRGLCEPRITLKASAICAKPSNREQVGHIVDRIALQSLLTFSDVKRTCYQSVFIDLLALLYSYLYFISLQTFLGSFLQEIYVVAYRFSDNVVKIGFVNVFFLIVLARSLSTIYSRIA